MSEQREEKNYLNPYIFPGLKVSEKEKNKIHSEVQHRYHKITKEELLEIISQESGVSVNDIIQRSRKREIINARFIFCSILKEHFGYTLTRIGEQMINGRDHTSVRHALIQYKNRINTEESFRHLVKRIYNKIS